MATRKIKHFVNVRITTTNNFYRGCSNWLWNIRPCIYTWTPRESWFYQESFLWIIFKISLVHKTQNLKTQTCRFHISLRFIQRQRNVVRGNGSLARSPVTFAFNCNVFGNMILRRSNCGAKINAVYVFEYRSFLSNGGRFLLVTVVRVDSCREMKKIA